jgi:hypothetical protein
MRSPCAHTYSNSETSKPPSFGGLGFQLPEGREVAERDKPSSRRRCVLGLSVYILLS